MNEPCIGHNVDLVKSLFKLRQGWEITSHSFLWIRLFIDSSANLFPLKKIVGEKWWTQLICLPLAFQCIIGGCTCAGNAGNVFPATAVWRSRYASRHVRDLRAVMHDGIAILRFPLKSVAGKTFPAFPAHAQPEFCVFGERFMPFN